MNELWVTTGFSRSRAQAITAYSRRDGPLLTDKEEQATSWVSQLAILTSNLSMWVRSRLLV